MNNCVSGALGEHEAVNYLLKHGYTIICRNFRVGKMGEIDIIANHAGTLCFIEVKTRSSDRYGTPAQAVSTAKQATITRLAQIYLQRNRIKDVPLRFDVVEIMMSRDGDIRNIELIQNAF